MASTDGNRRLEGEELRVEATRKLIELLTISRDELVGAASDAEFRLVLNEGDAHFWQSVSMTAVGVILRLLEDAVDDPGVFIRMMAADL